MFWESKVVELVNAENGAVRILVVTLSNIGDAIMTTPVLTALHAQYPQAKIDLVCDPRSSALFDDCPYLGQRFVRDKKSGWRGYWRLIQAVRHARYDIIVDLRTDFLAYLLRGTKRYHKRPNAHTMHLHSVEKHLLAVAPLLGHVPPVLTLWASAQTEQQVAQQFDLPGRWLAIGPGANFAGKVWPVTRYIAVANALRHDIDGMVLVGGPADQALAEAVMWQAQLPVQNACGRLSLPQTYALLKRCHFYLGNDSGLGHMAAAAGLPSLTLFGPGAPGRYKPWSPQAAFIQDAQQQIAGISVTQVVERIQSLLTQVRERV